MEKGNNGLAAGEVGNLVAVPFANQESLVTMGASEYSYKSK